MRIEEVWIRFYKSFNYDYELKANPNSTSRPWQETGDGWLPHVCIPLEPGITAVVGANESGKSHMLDAINIVLTGDGLHKRDFCRYSPLFSVETGNRLFPEVGATFELTDSDSEVVTALKIPMLKNHRLLMLRTAPEEIDVVDSEGERVTLDDDQRKGLEGLLPSAYQLNTQVDLPDSVSIDALAEVDATVSSRKTRTEILTLLSGLTSADAIAGNAASLLNLSSRAQGEEDEQQRLGRLLLTKVAHIEASAFQELKAAIENEREGLVNALIQEMNKSIARHLNISRWWSQDADFQLRVSPREHELVFTIRDRTGTDYSFSERSRGLTYFLSYYVQLRSHDRPADRPEVLLMDEPDAYLSAVGQQDLLRVLEDHAHPEDSDREDQVVYVTHSPFLINRNAGHRVRVVDKGSHDEGTRLVKDVTQNHYEPLRTSMGAFIAETAFIGGDNLFVEGIADQVLIAGMNARLLRAGTAPSECLDLNKVTIVPGGSNVPYMLYLARGRDQFKPACAVLLDSDKSGEIARSQIKKGGAKGRPTVDDDLILMVGDWAKASGAKAATGVTIEEPEDLIPTKLAAVAARRYAMHLLGLSETDANKLTEKAIKDQVTAGKASMWDAVAQAFEAAFETSLGKAGFAKELLAFLAEHEQEETPPEGVDILDDNFRKLITQLASTLRLAREREDSGRRDQRVNRIIEEFVADHPTGCIRDTAAAMLHRVDAAADDSTEGDTIRAGTASLRRRYQLGTDRLTRVPDYANFLVDLKSVPVMVRLTDQGLLTDEQIEAASQETQASS